MQYLFSGRGIRNLDAYVMSRVLCAFDFDGTLAKIVSKPGEAEMSPKTLRLLRSLAERVPVAIISGRGLRDLERRARLNGRKVHLIGNHGLEGLPRNRYSVDRARRICARWKKQLNARLVWHPGTVVEDKIFSIALHYRNSKSKKTAKAQLLQQVSALVPSPRVILGKHVINIVPPGAPHKGMALLELLIESRCDAAIYVGDDDTDEDIFCLPEHRILTVRVGYKEGSRARFFLKRQGEVNRLLEQVLELKR